MKILQLLFIIFLLPNMALAANNINVCIPSDNAPFAYSDVDGKLIGFDMDILEGMKLEAKINAQNLDFATSMAGLSNGVCDMVLSNVIITESRKNRFLFSKSRIKSGLYAAVLKDSHINDVNALQYSIIGVLKGSVAEEYAFGKLKGSVIYALRQNSNIISMLKEGTIEAILDSLPVLQTLQKSHDVRILEPSLAEEQFAYAFAKNKEDLRDMVDAALDKMEEDGTSAKIYEKWFGPTTKPTAN